MTADIVERLRAPLGVMKCEVSTGPAPENKLERRWLVALEAAAEIDRLRAALRDEPTQEQIYNACMSYRHDFGLLSVDERKTVAFTAKEWLRAWQKTLARAALGEKA